MVNLRHVDERLLWGDTTLAARLQPLPLGEASAKHGGKLQSRTILLRPSHQRSLNPANKELVNSHRNRV